MAATCPWCSGNDDDDNDDDDDDKDDDKDYVDDDDDDMSLVFRGRRSQPGPATSPCWTPGAGWHNSIPPTVEASKNFFTLSVQIHFHSIILQCFCKFHFEGTNSLSMCIFAGTPCNNLYDSANLLIFFLLPSLNIIS